MNKPLSPFEHLKEYRKQSLQAGGAKRLASQHKKGKMSARERISSLLDEGSFIELDRFVVHDCIDFNMSSKKPLGDGVITGWGRIMGRVVYVFSQDFTVFGGSLSWMVAKKICKIMELATQNGAPLIGLNDSGGARIHEGVASLGGYAEIFHRNVKASGVIPQLSLIMGPCAGGAVYSPAITDFTFMVEGSSHMFVTGPNVIKTVTGENISFEQLGGSQTHTQQSGVVDLSFPSDAEAILAARKWISYIPSNNLEGTNSIKFEAEQEKNLEDRMQKLDAIIPEKSNQSYNMLQVIELIFDNKSVWEMQSLFASNIITCFARLEGVSVGIVANNPQHMAGALDINASIKAARFIRFCDAFQIPIISFVDVPGFLPGSHQEKNGIIRHGAKLLYAYSEASVPLLTVITRKAYGGAYDVMSSKHIGSDLNLAWPSAEIAVMGAQGACEIIFKEQIKKSKNPTEEREKLTSSYSQKFYHPYLAAQKGYIDSVIFPRQTRNYLIEGLKSNFSKKIDTPKRKHGNIPL